MYKVYADGIIMDQPGVDRLPPAGASLKGQVPWSAWICRRDPRDGRISDTDQEVDKGCWRSNFQVLLPMRRNVAVPQKLSGRIYALSGSWFSTIIVRALRYEAAPFIKRAFSIAFSEGKGR